MAGLGSWGRWLMLVGLSAALVMAVPGPAGAVRHRRHHLRRNTFSPASKTFQFSSASYSAEETDGSVTITVTRSASRGPASVHVATSDGTATANTDYSPVSTTVSFKSGQSSKTVSVSILDDQASGEDPTATVNLGLDTPSHGYTVGSAAVLTIHEDSAPSAPANLQVTGSDPYDVSLGWDASTNASGYTIYRSTTSGSGYTQIGTSSTNSFTDSTAGSASDYYYVVNATNDDGSSDNSSEAHATTPSNLLSNGDFETGDFTDWTTGTGGCVGQCHNVQGVPGPSIDSTTFLGGSYSAFLGQATGCFIEGSGQAFIYHTLTVPSTGTTKLTWYYNGQSDDSIGYDGQQVLITGSTGLGNVLATPQNIADNSRTWTKGAYDLTSLAGTDIRVYFRVYEDGAQFADCTGMNVDNVSVTNS